MPQRNKKETKEYMRKYYKEHRKELLLHHNKYYQEHKKERHEYNKKWRKENPEKAKKWTKEHPEETKHSKRKHWRKIIAKTPWTRHYYSAKSRCENPSDISYKYYGGRDIQMLLTMEETKVLYNRDNAKNMERPSIDRINNNGNYYFDNCRFIEFSENSRKGHIERKTKSI